MSEPDLADLRAMEAILRAIAPLKSQEQVRVMSWIIDKLDLALDMKIAIKGSTPHDRNYIEMAWEKVPNAMESAGEFVSSAAPASIADRVLVVATFLQMNADDPDVAALTGREINNSLKSMRSAVANVTDCIYTLMKRTPPHMMEMGRIPERKQWKAYRVTESGINYVYQRIVEKSSNNS
jgi:hypothetical protein